MTDIDRHTLYQKFQSEFPLDKLDSLPLERYTNLNRTDSFCYWLESETYKLGSIWGGSSYKFGIYRYQKTPQSEDSRIKFDDAYAWYSKYNADTREKAYAVVRDVIVKIANAAQSGDYGLIDGISELGNSYKWKIAFLYSDEKLLPIYKKKFLRTIANKMGGNFNRSAKTSDMQYFLISKQGDKNIYDYYDELWSLLPETEKNMPESDEDSDEVRYWLYAPGEGASQWQRCVETSTMCLGWDELGDFTQYESKDKVRDKLRELTGKSNSSFKNDSHAVWCFLSEMMPGDVIFAKKGTGKILGRGVVEGEYEYDPSQPSYTSVRKVRWETVGEWNVHSQLVQKTLTDVTDYPDLVNKITEAINDKGDRHYWWLVASPKYWSFSDLPVGESVDYTVKNDNGNKRRVPINFEQAREGDIVIGYEANPVKKIVALAKVSKASDGETIKYEKTEELSSPIGWFSFKDIPELKEMEFIRNPNGSFFKLTQAEYETIMNLIRQENPEPEDNPVVRKAEVETYTRKDFLNEVFIGEDELDELLSLILQKKNIILQGAPGVGKTYSAKRIAYTLMEEKDDSRIEIVQFHQNYSYEDFIMGFKPTVEGGFELRTGSFYDFCKRAAEDAERPYFFIIDEINRGNLSKIFGELLMLIENGYRNKPIRLAYRKEMFAVPKNLYIIGMMNTADRSLAMIDYALRRRFSFFPMSPGFDTEGFKKELARHSDARVAKIVEAIKDLNKTIVNDDSLGEGFRIGHSYFCNQSENDEWIENVVKYDICPMIDEYWFDNKEKCEAEQKRLLDLL